MASTDPTLKEGYANGTHAAGHHERAGAPMSPLSMVTSGHHGPVINQEGMSAFNRKFANPGPLGLSAFALTTFVLSLVNVEARGVKVPTIVLGLAFAYGGLVQLLAGMWEFAVGNTFGATALSSYGGFWISYAYLIAGGDNSYGALAAYTSPKDLQSALGFYLIAWWIFTTLLLFCTLKSNLAFFMLFFLLDITFLLLAIGHFQNANGVEKASCIKAGGVFGLITAFVAWYNAWNGLAEQANSFFIPPVYHFPWSERMKRKAEHAV